MKSLITEALGLYGWTSLEPVLLAALTDEKPMLLIGKHGCAKSFILESLAKALKKSFRFYNASLINYDDLVGIPIPTEDKKSLTYISNPNSIWDAEVVFIDEINRTKYELQNKLFPIIYDKRVQGQNLEKLIYRWAAMNPPVDDNDENGQSYLGAEELDAALIDRFSYIVRVPDWSVLSGEEKKHMLMDVYAGSHSFEVDIDTLINKTKENIEKIKSEFLDLLSDYIMILMSLLNKQFGYISARRASIFLESFIAIHAARLTLKEYTQDENDVDYVKTSIIQLKNNLNYSAYENVSELKIVAICKEAWNQLYAENPNLKDVLGYSLAEKKLVHLFKDDKEVGDIEFSKKLLNIITEFDNLKERRAATLISFNYLKHKSEVPATTMETLGITIKPCFKLLQKTIFNAKSDKLYMRILSELNTYDNAEEKKNAKMLLYSFFPDEYNDENEIVELSNFFKKLNKEVKDAE